VLIEKMVVLTIIKLSVITMSEGAVFSVRPKFYFLLDRVIVFELILENNVFR
jgi:hypothetical protein